MAQSGRFGLALRILLTLADTQDSRQTSAAIADTLETSPVMVRRLFSTLHTAGFITQRKGPSGGARLKHSPKSIGLGDLYFAVEPGWMTTGDKTLDSSTAQARKEATAALNETTLAAVLRKSRKTKPAAAKES